MMIKLSPRLETIKREITKGESMADIGTDHGFLPIALWEEGISPKVIMTDASESSLKKAEKNCKKYYPEKQFDLRLGNGLQVLKPAETDVVVIAGMGGLLMAEILEANEEKSRSFQKIILQPRNHVGQLRHWLFHHGFSIVKEQLVREGKYICEIITAKPGEVGVILSMEADRIEYQYPHSLIDFRNELTMEYLEEKRRIEEHIFAQMEKSVNADSKLLRSRRYRMEYLEDMIQRCKEKEGQYEIGSTRRKD